MSAYCINFCFKNLLYDSEYICGGLEASDTNVYCEFEYNRHTEEVKIWNNSQPIESIVPLPLWWLNANSRKTESCIQQSQKLAIKIYGGQ